MDSELASSFTGSLLHTITSDAARASGPPDAFKRLVEEQTPGGLNERGLKTLRERGVFDHVQQVLDTTLDIIRSKLA